ncbi:MAG: carbohydrate-binding family 9-like protein [Bacteroidales bacterium]|nr:carbohydrate-binding family 9-like protein [Bacteroidales bacterium]
MKVRKISIANVQVNALPKLLDEAKIDFQPIDNANWSETYPYKPKAEFRIAYTDDAILLHYKVKEASVRGKYSKDNDPVWTDACVEFFFIPASDGVYYNIECNCIGTILLGAGSSRAHRERASQVVMDKVQRWSSLGCKPLDERLRETSWEVALIIPYSTFFKHHITSLDGKTLRGNFYKCGDELQTPHFLSWKPIPIEKPDFHRPDFFGTLEFESR